MVFEAAGAKTGMTAGSFAVVEHAMPVLQTLWRIMAKLLGIPQSSDRVSIRITPLSNHGNIVAAVAPSETMTPLLAV